MYCRSRMTGSLMNWTNVHPPVRSLFTTSIRRIVSQLRKLPCQDVVEGFPDVVLVVVFCQLELYQ